MATSTGAPWRDVPEKYGKWNSIYRRFRRWSACGVWESVAIALAETMAESGHYDPAKRRTAKSYGTLIDLPERVPGALVADKAYDSDAIRDDLKQRGGRHPAKIKPHQDDPLQQAALPSAQLYRAGARPPQDQPRRRHMI